MGRGFEWRRIRTVYLIILQFNELHVPRFWIGARVPQCDDGDGQNRKRHSVEIEICFQGNNSNTASCSSFRQSIVGV
jgi:hypothetical protein